ncbi:hypothetical protein E8E14_014627 [Neopestalotiopsis sp. 37M]|nr:hypothetical protein E8E14_014627 [Neopestalotiopsis sp. 37M]
MTTVRLDDYDMIFDDGTVGETDEEGVDIVDVVDVEGNPYTVKNGGIGGYSLEVNDDEVEAYPQDTGDEEADGYPNHIEKGMDDAGVYDGQMETSAHDGLHEYYADENIGDPEDIRPMKKAKRLLDENDELSMDELALDSELWDQSEREIDTTKFIEARLEGTEGTTTTPKAVLQVARKNHQGSGRTTHETSPHLHISKKARLSKSPSLLSAQSTPLSHEQRMAENSRLRARQAPKPFSDEMSRALAIMDQEIRDLAQSQPKKRGRGRPPKNSSVPKVTVTATTSGSGTPRTGGGPGTGIKRRGRPPKAPALSVRDIYLQTKPKFISFSCEWHDPQLHPAIESGKCPAELQNMETLRRHVLFVHNYESGSFVCKWGKCASETKPVLFDDEQAWTSHMELKHLTPYSWHMGDGVQNRGIEELKNSTDPEVLPRYLFSDDGQQVTPSIRDQQFDDLQATMDRKRMLSDIRRQAEENAPTEMEHRLQLLGQTIPPPARLVNQGAS